MSRQEPRGRRVTTVNVNSDRNRAPASTRERIVTAAIETLREEGFAGTSARSIARRGDFNQALIFYHFGSVIDVLVSALERVSADRLAQYRGAVAGVADLGSALAVAREQYATDVREGHITVLAELVAGASSVPQLGPEMVRCMEPWIGFAEETISGFLEGTPLAALIPAREAAHALLAIYLGMELLGHLAPHVDTAGPLFLVAERMLAAVEPFIGGGDTGGRRGRPGRASPQRVTLEEGAPATPPGSPAPPARTGRARR